MMPATTEEALRRVCGLCESLECILISAETVEQNSSLIASALFMLTELKDAIQKLEEAARGWTITERAND